MARTYKDNPSYLKNIKKKKEARSKKYHSYKAGEDIDWESSHNTRGNRDPYYECVERKLPIYYDEFLVEDLIDQMDFLNDIKNDAA